MQLPTSTSGFTTQLPRGGVFRYVAVAVVFILVVGFVKFTPDGPSLSSYPSSAGNGFDQAPPAPLKGDHAYGHGASTAALPSSPTSESLHPIETLIKAAEAEYNLLMSKETHDVGAAAAEYRNRRGRHPPPGFQAWFEFAKKNGVIMVEEFFDQIHHDLAPFWGVDPHQIRLEAKNFEMTISVRGGKASSESEWFWTKIWLDLVKSIEAYLPDLDMALNAMDEPRLLVPWERINEYMADERKTRFMPPPSEVSNQLQGLVEFDKEPRQALNDKWDREYPYFPKARKGCRPDDPARQVELVSDWSQPPGLNMEYARPHTYEGYVSNFSLSTSYCHQPDLQTLHGMFIEPLSIRSSEHLMPMFGGSKLGTNNEILLPAPMYWANEERFSGGNDHGNPWEEKEDVVIWRGAATGGRNTAKNWKGFQRHRFVSMLNATSVKRAEDRTESPPNFELPAPFYELKAAKQLHMGEWVDSFSDVGLVDLVCFPKEEEGACGHTDPYFHVKMGKHMAEQFRSKYLPDIDGNSFSGRYRGFLMSTSLPIKATIFREWHDSRLIPWKHFVPMDNRFQDFYGIMEYFFGYKGFGEEDKDNIVEGHDAAAKKIALEGQEWANKVLRPEDMQAYVFRLLLEYARISDDNRTHLGYVEDLLQAQKVAKLHDHSKQSDSPKSGEQQRPDSDKAGTEAHQKSH
ncbi:MAG: hypothetical protein M1837_002901 [Sclerophora amabilis]|nr:MAG: hypothetical protein M1837_002901 [Sclerophora amabilis]